MQTMDYQPVTSYSKPVQSSREAVTSIKHKLAMYEITPLLKKKGKKRATNSSITRTLVLPPSELLHNFVIFLARDVVYTSRAY